MRRSRRCRGALAETALPQITYYRCHVGHQFGPQSLAAAQADAAEAKLWAAVATLEETAALARHLAGHTDLGDDAAGRQGMTADWAARLAELLRAQAQDGRPVGDDGSHVAEAVGDGGQIWPASHKWPHRQMRYLNWTRLPADGWVGHAVITSER
jgi:hypothetical protein